MYSSVKTEFLVAPGKTKPIRIIEKAMTAAASRTYPYVSGMLMTKLMNVKNYLKLSDI